MRIEINAGGIGGVSVLDYQTHMQSFVSDADSVIASFKAVKSNTYNLNGGVGNLQGALDSISARVQQEEAKKMAATQIQSKANDFLSLVARVDKQVAVDVEQNKDEFYRTNPWLKPVSSTDETAWYEDAWNWLCGVKDSVVEGAKAIWTGIKDTVKKAWDGLVAFYNEHKKIIDTILIVVGAVLAIAAVIGTGGAALIPLLTTLGASAGVATAISAAVAVVAVVSTLGSSVLNIVDIWCEIDATTFNTWQSVLGWTSTISNITYSIGTIFNSIKHYSNSDIYNYVKKSYADDGITYGGSYKDVFKTSDSSLYEVHECPSFKVTGDKYRKQAPSIRMEIADHAKTGSFGSSRQAMRYRTQQLSYMKDDNFSAAFKMDIDDLKQFGFKYAKEIQDMKKYAKIFKTTRGLK